MTRLPDHIALERYAWPLGRPEPWTAEDEARATAIIDDLIPRATWKISPVDRLNLIASQARVEQRLRLAKAGVPASPSGSRPTGRAAVFAASRRYRAAILNAGAGR